MTKMLELCGVSKTFPGAIALDSVDFDLRAGEVHVLFGENGAGKSTLINIIAGTMSPTRGDLLFRGSQLTALTPLLARSMGIAVVFQEFSLVSELTVEENLFLGRERLRFGLLDKAAMTAKASAILSDLRFSISSGALTGDLSRAQQQMIEIAKALLFEPKVLVLDEPTASLTEAETAILFEAIARLKNAGVGIIYVSHRMQEIRALADRVSVLRDGRKIKTVLASETTNDELVALMAGRKMEQLYPPIAHNPGPPRLVVEDLTSRGEAVKHASLTLRGGEIIGIGGLIGSGKSEFVRALFGLEPIAFGTISVDGVAVPNPTPAAMLARKLCYFPSDRNTEGLALTRSVIENASITALSTPALMRGPFLRKNSERSLIGRIANQLAIKPRRTDTMVRNLSGGNRQKVVLARGLARPTEIYLFEEPTVGIDVGAKLDVYKTIQGIVEQGHAVLLVSSDLSELLHLSHQLLIFSGGQIVARLEGENLTEKEALSHFFTRRGVVTERAP
ncbi:sugar ABC transporter ATP-binding protein [Bradyrhizobium prioriisuperbiae]|uniref:sugar ABC transporter ATP-binding protein n=1 Tax=Bradyrhizobium prioriisuperbiae TaxID=2854389 RepID=UPI0028E2C14B|nr:sugar ABC transporter ATP-binding protein [Bradyrhizobium prioritasuperba]